MKKTIAAVAMVATSAVSLASSAIAQETAMEEAIRRGYCAEGIPPVSAERLADGRLKVVCPAGSVSAPAALGGTGLSAGAAGALLAAGLLVLVVSGDGTVTTTTTTN